jgi:hypothetical protein
MHTTDRVEPFRRHKGFKERYEGVSKFIDQVHTVKALDIQSSWEPATVNVLSMSFNTISLDTSVT